MNYELSLEPPQNVPWELGHLTPIVGRSASESDGRGAGEGIEPTRQDPSGVLPGARPGGS